MYQASRLDTDPALAQHRLDVLWILSAWAVWVFHRCPTSSKLHMQSLWLSYRLETRAERLEAQMAEREAR